MWYCDITRQCNIATSCDKATMRDCDIVQNHNKVSLRQSDNKVVNATLQNCDITTMSHHNIGEHFLPEGSNIHALARNWTSNTFIYLVYGKYVGCMSFTWDSCLRNWRLRRQMVHRVHESVLARRKQRTKLAVPWLDKSRSATWRPICGVLYDWIPRIASFQTIQDVSPFTSVNHWHIAESDGTKLFPSF